LRAVIGMINGKQTESVRKGEFVLFAILLRHVAPVASLMTLDCQEYVFLSDVLQCIRSGYDSTEAEPGFGNCRCAHSPKSSIVAAMASSSSPRISTKPAF